MREFLSQNSVEFEDRNIAKERHWREDLMALTGEIVVPVLVVNGKQVTGLDEVRMAEALGKECFDGQAEKFLPGVAKALQRLGVHFDNAASFVGDDDPGGQEADSEQHREVGGELDQGGVH